MSLRLRVKSADTRVQKQRRATARRVVDCFGDQLHGHNLLCFLDDEEWQAIKDASGAENRDLYTPVRACPELWEPAPSYIQSCLFRQGRPLFHDFVYLHGTTCSSEVGLTMTFAHELRHFIQRSKMRHVWAAKNLILSLIHSLDPTVIRALALTWCDIPTEREARIISKRIAQDLLGEEAVGEYINERIANPVTADDGADWVCVRDLSTSAPYDLAAETQKLFRRMKAFRGQVENLRDDGMRDRANVADLEGIDLDVLFQG